MAAPDLYGLSKDDVRFIKWMKTRLEGILVNTPSARLSELLLDDGHQAPEVYIALVPDGGIPACEGPTGTGGPIFEAGDIPGYADCGIYQVINGVIQYTRQIKRVYNLTGSVINQQWVAVKRDKYGIWLPDGGGTPCEDRNEVWMIAMTTGVEGGTFTLSFIINAVQETVTVNAESTAAEVKTAMAAHSELVESDLNVEGGPLPDNSIRIEFIGTQAGKEIRLISFSGENLNNIPGTGTGTPATESGLLVLIFRWTPGHTA